MKKRILGMAFSILLAFGMVLGAMPEQKVCAEEVSGDICIYDDGEIAEYSLYAQGNRIMGVNSVDDEGIVSLEEVKKSVSVSGKTITISNFKNFKAHVYLTAYANDYEIVVKGENVINILEGYILQCANFTITCPSKGDELRVYQCLGCPDGTKREDSILASKISLGTDTSAIVLNEDGSDNADFLWSEYAPTLDTMRPVVFTHNSALINGGSNNTTDSGSSASISPEVLVALAGNGSATANVSATPVAAASVAPDMSANSSIDSAKVKTAENGTAKISNIKSDAEEVEIDDTIEVDGVSYKVKTLGKGALKKCKEVVTLTLPSSLTKIEKGAFTGAKNLKSIRLNVKKAITVQKGAFKGVDTKKLTIKVSKKMSDKEFSKFQKTLKKAGYEGKVGRSLK